MLQIRKIEINQKMRPGAAPISCQSCGMSVYKNPDIREIYFGNNKPVCLCGNCVNALKGVLSIMG